MIIVLSMHIYSAAGLRYDLPAAVAINDTDITFDAAATKKATASASGILMGVSVVDAEAVERDLKARLMGELRLYRNPDSTLYTRVRLVSAKVDTYRGRFDGRVVGVNLRFEALDGFACGQPLSTTIALAGANVTRTLANPGSFPARASFRFTASAGSNFSGAFASCGGRAIVFASPLAVANGLVLTIDDEAARLGNDDRTALLAEDSIIRPVEFAPGDNSLVITGANKTGSLVVTWTPRWPA